MIDRKHRDKLAETLRHYVSGQITNDELEDVTTDSRDRGIIAVQEAAWCLYSDLYPHKAKGRHYLNKEVRSTIARWIAFLYSEQEYTWPEYAFDQIDIWGVNIITFGWWKKKKQEEWERFQAAGDIDIWPFRIKEEFQNALHNPKLLANTRAFETQNESIPNGT